MVLEKIGSPLVLKEMEVPEPAPTEVLIKVHTCGVCRTDLHIVDGELPASHLPLILGHQIVGTIEKLGTKAAKHSVGVKVGVPWLANCCNQCEFCKDQRENLCDDAIFTGYQHFGGFADYCTAHEDFIVSLPPHYDDLSAAPLLCAGLIGYRAFRLAGRAKTMGFYGFGSSAHILVQMAKALGCQVYVFTKPGDEKTQELARSLGASWAGGADQTPPIALDAAIIFAPVGALYLQALKAIKKGGRVVSAGIHMSPIPSFSYDLLWGERSMSSVANLTRQDSIDFMKIACTVPLKVLVTPFDLTAANEALRAIKEGSLRGSAVLKI